MNMSATETLTGHFQPSIGGMTCSACAARIQKVLGQVDGIQSATVNFATALPAASGISRERPFAAHWKAAAFGRCPRAAPSGSP